jgi:type IV fimbrial biogenesis protein FimT
VRGSQAPHRTTGAGFTLVELLVTIAVLAILITIAAPSMVDVVDRRRLVGAAEAVQNEVRYARSEAIKQSRNMFVTFSNTGGTSWCLGIDELAGCDCTVTDPTVSNVGGDGACAIDSVLKILSAAQVSNVTLQGGGAVEIQFDNVRGTAQCDGIACSDAAIQLLSAGGRDLRVRVNALGRVSMCSPSGTTNVPGYPTCP